MNKQGISKQENKIDCVKANLYHVWCCMKQRCYNKKATMYHLYGKRGIAVGDEWINNFIAFYEWAIKSGYKHEKFGNKKINKLTLDRINNNGNYEPSNCRWATRKEQSRNTRFAKLLDIDGESKCIAEWAEISGNNSDMIAKRIRQGMPIKEAVFKPSLRCKSKINRTDNGGKE